MPIKLSGPFQRNTLIIAEPGRVARWTALCVLFHCVKEASDLGRDELAGRKQCMHVQRLAHMIRQHAAQQPGVDGRAGIARGDPENTVAGERRLQPNVGIRAD